MSCASGNRAAVHLRELTDADWPAVWTLLEPVFRAGETYAVPPGISAGEARRHWVDVPTAAYVAVEDEGEILGTYYLKPNHAGPGDHVANSGYVVSEAARGRGIATAMCEHSQREAISRGFRAMQFNLVVSTNPAAVRLWERLGFAIVGTLPEAFQHPRDGHVDAHVMFKTLRTVE